MNIYVTRLIPDAALNTLREAGHTVRMWEGALPVPRETLLHEVATADGLLTLLTEKVDAELLDAAPQLKVVANFAVGYDNIDVAEAARRGVHVGNTPGVLTESTADVAFMLIMAAGRRFTEAYNDVKAGKWQTWEPLGWLGQDIGGATLGIVGFGRIGQAVARRGRGFNMRILYTNRTAKPDAEAELGAEQVDLDTLLQTSDFVSIHTPLTPETYHLIDERELSLMKQTAVLVNTARGGVVNGSALYVALRAKMIFAAGLDVTEPEPLPANSPLLTLDNCIVLPHVGSGSIGTRTQMGMMCAANLLAGLNGEPLPHPVTA